MSTDASGTGETQDERNAALEAVWRRCWCWQYGRCLVNCPTADHPRPRPCTDAAWEPAARALMDAARNGGSAVQ